MPATWRADLFAGLAIAGLLLPEAVAYSRIGHLPPQAGVVALFAGLLLYPLAGNSRFAIVSSTSSSAAVMAAAVWALSDGNPVHVWIFSTALVMVTGVLFIIAGVGKLGDMTTYIAKPVLRGFTFGLALVIIAKQVADMVHVYPPYTDLFRYTAFLLAHMRDWNVYGLLLGFTAWLFLMMAARIPFLPVTLMVIALSIVAGHWIDWSQWHITLVGSLDMGMVHPGVPVLPEATWLRLTELGFGMVLILYAESYGSIRMFSLKYGDAFEPNRDLVALGIANMISGFFQGMPVGAGYSGTSANEAAGAQSRAAGLAAAAVLGVMVWIFRPALSQTPNPVLGAIVVYVLSHTLNPAAFRPYVRLHRDRSVVIAAILAVMFLGVLDGLMAGILFSLVVTLRRFSQPLLVQLGHLEGGHDYMDLALHTEAHPVPGLLILRPGEPLFFANADRIAQLAFEQTCRQKAQVHTLVLSLEESPDLDSTALESMANLFARLRQEGIQLVLARIKDRAFQGLQRLEPALPEQCLSLFSVAETVQAILNASAQK